MSTPRFLPVLRAALALQTVALLVQAITAGLLLSTPGGRGLHGASAGAVMITTLLYLLAAVLVWRPGGGSPRGILSAVVMLVFVVAQAMLGVAHMKTLHVPLGVLMFGGSLVHLIQAWPARRPGTAVAA